jgi:acetyl esterase/lipase
MKSLNPFGAIVLLFCLMTAVVPGATGKERKIRAAERLLNVRYGTDTVQQTLDCYLPAGRSRKRTPVMVAIHGGAWISGDKGDMADLGIDTVFAGAGYAVVNMNYRLCDKYRYPAQTEDVDAVLRMVKKQSRKWHVNRNAIYLIGRSAGGQLALLYAYTHNGIRAVVACCAPTDFTDPGVTQGPLGVNVTNWLGAYESHKDVWKGASPIYYVNGAVPTFLLHGAQDNLVLPSQTDRLVDSLQHRHIPVKLIRWPESGHGWNIPKWAQDHTAVTDWLKEIQKAR